MRITAKLKNIEGNGGFSGLYLEIQNLSSYSRYQHFIGDTLMIQ